MARFFTLPFTWQDKNYTALVTLRPAGNDVHYTIVLPDAALKAAIPQGILKFYGKEGAALLDAYTNPSSRTLIENLISELVHKYT